MIDQTQDVCLASDQVTGIVLAGGASRRMGRNKALLPIEGVSMIERTVRALHKVSSRVILSTNTPDTYQFLGLECVSDLYIRQGPMAGLHAALKASRSRWNIVAACDMPYIDEHILRKMLDVAETQHTAEAVVPVVGGRMHPLLAVYRRDVVTSLEHNLMKGQLRLMGWIQDLDAVFVNEEQLQRIPVSDLDLDPCKTFFNMNTPRDYAAVCGPMDSDLPESKH